MMNLFTNATIDEATGELIIRKISEETNIEFELIIGKTRPKEVSIARQTAMYIIRIMTDMPFKNIGKLFGDKDHTTVMHAMKSIEAEYQTNKKFKANLRKICNDIKPDLLDILDQIGKKKTEEKKEESRLKRVKRFDMKQKQKAASF